MSFKTFHSRIVIKLHLKYEKYNAFLFMMSQKRTVLECSLLQRRSAVFTALLLLFRLLTLMFQTFFL